MKSSNTHKTQKLLEWPLGIEVAMVKHIGKLGLEMEKQNKYSRNTN